MWKEEKKRVKKLIGFLCDADLPESMKSAAIKLLKEYGIYTVENLVEFMTKGDDE